MSSECVASSYLWHQRCWDIVDNIRFDPVGFGSLIKSQATSSATLVPIGQRTIVPVKREAGLNWQSLHFLFVFEILSFHCVKLSFLCCVCVFSLYFYWWTLTSVYLKQTRHIWWYWAAGWSICEPAT